MENGDPVLLKEGVWTAVFTCSVSGTITLGGDTCRYWDKKIGK